MLNAYFETAERVWSRCQAIKAKLAADGIMAVFPSAYDAVCAAQDMRQEVGKLLQAYGLQAGIGVHAGPLVEGILGSSDVKGYDVIGDTVNTARRLCDAAAGGEILLSPSVVGALGPELRVVETREITVKGKEQPLRVAVLQELVLRDTIP
jgi:class 3 adenylate cyclase